MFINLFLDVDELCGPGNLMTIFFEDFAFTWGHDRDHRYTGLSGKHKMTPWDVFPRMDPPISCNLSKYDHETYKHDKNLTSYPPTIRLQIRIKFKQANTITHEKINFL